MWKFMFLFFAQCSCLYRESELILKVTANNYEDYVESESKPVVLHAYAPLSQQSIDASKQFMAIADELKGLMKFACLQMDKERDLARELGILKPNSFYIVNHGQLHQFSGPLSAKRIVSVAMNQVLSNLDAPEEIGFQYFFRNVKQLNEENFEENIQQDTKPWMVLFYSPKISESKQMIPLWYDAAQLLKEEVNFGSVDCTNNIVLAKEYDVGGYPTGILLIKEAIYYLHFNVHLTPEFIVEWIKVKMDEYKEDNKINELTNNYIYEKCIEKQLCVITFVPHILECAANCRNTILQTITDISQKYLDYKWGWLWSELGSQGELERVLGIENYNIPRTVVINSKKRMYFSLRGSNSQKDVEEFLQDILRGRVNSWEMEKYVQIFDSPEWDGKNGEERKNNLDFFDFDVKMKDEL
ncbi:hypothetical protein WA026_010986 [Henosepilachna vigintioctopunctata]|uniref:Thioredoxin domain-containing protein n=1 Tax=Henosepilachna vigintioctopunctata TaxID=420089 RepID=A0AAW1UWK6_9CUCU